MFSKVCGSAAVISALWSGVVAFGVIFLLTELCSRYQSGNLIDTAVKAFGNFGRYIVTIIVAACLFISAITTLGELSQLSKVISFPTAPLWYVLVFYALGAVCGALGNIGVITRLHGIFVPLVIAGLAILIISVIFGGDISRIFPILGEGIQATFGKGLSGIIMFSDILLFFLILPKNTAEPFPKKKILTASVIGISISVLFVFALVLSVSPTVAAEDSFPFYLVLKEVYYGRFFQRIDAIMLFLSAVSGMLYLSLNAASFSCVTDGIFKTGRQKLISTFYMVFTSISTLLASVISSKVLEYLIFLLSFGGIALLIITMFFARGRKSNEKT